jgi:rhamnosyltransferase
MRNSQPLISVIIPTLNAGEGLKRLLDTVKAQQVPGELEILVIDSGSRDGTSDLARRRGARLMSVPRRQFSHGRTRNHAIQASRGEFVALTVQDALPLDDHWLARLLAPMLEQPEVAGNYGLQVAPPASSLLSRTRSSLWCEANALPVVRSLKAPSEYQEMSPEERLQLIRFDDVTSCIRRTVWEEFQLPERDYGEDMAWAKNALLAGYKIAYTPEARVWHTHERGPIYELRRAYVDGYTRVQLVNWPALSLELSEVFAILRRMTFFLLTKRFDSVVDVEAAHKFLLAEMYHSKPLVAQKPVQIYRSILEFTMSLTRRASCFCPEGVFPEKAWIGLLRFATVAIVGQTLGATAATKVNAPRFSAKLVWHVLHRFLGASI